jgi:hypothetical protein
MKELIASIGPLQFRLSRVEHPAVSPNFAAEPFLFLDGTEVELCSNGPETYLLVDHRGDERGPARIEFWECLGSPELELVGLYTVTNASP